MLLVFAGTLDFDRGITVKVNQPTVQTPSVLPTIDLARSGF